MPKNEVDKLRDRVNKASISGPTNIQPMMVRESATFKLTAGELLAACKECPDHPNVPIFVKAAETLPENYPVVIERLDLEAMLNGQEVETYTTLENIEGTKEKARVVRKRLKGTPKAQGKPVKPATTKPEAKPKAEAKDN